MTEKWRQELAERGINLDVDPTADADHALFTAARLDLPHLAGASIAAGATVDDFGEGENENFQPMGLAFLSGHWEVAKIIANEGNLDFASYDLTDWLQMYVEGASGNMSRERAIEAVDQYRSLMAPGTPFHDRCLKRLQVDGEKVTPVRMALIEIAAAVVGDLEALRRCKDAYDGLGPWKVVDQEPHGLGLDGVDRYWGSPRAMVMAIFAGHSECACYLAREVDPKAIDYSEAAVASVLTGDMACLARITRTRHLLDQRSSPEERDNREPIPSQLLHFAAEHYPFEMAEQLRMGLGDEMVSSSIPAEVQARIDAAVVRNEAGVKHRSRLSNR